jgi:allantoin racemase
MRITVVLPVVKAEIGQSRDYFEAHRSPDVELSIVAIDEGPASIESDLDIAHAAPAIVRRVREAEASGADAVIINCMADPALFASREAVRIPVMGPAQSAFALAATLSDRFSVLGTTSRDIPFTRDLWRRYGHVERGASVRVVDLPVLSLQREDSDLLGRLTTASVAAIEEDGAGAVVFGCTLMAPHREDLAAALAARGHRGIPVIDSLAVALRTAEMLVRLGIRPSDVTWPPVA